MILTAVLVVATPLVALPAVRKGTRVQTGVASVYWPGDKHSGATCADGKPFTKERCHIAHRSWPLGRRVRVCSLRTKRCTTTFVGDRGPWGACDKRGVNPRTFACRGRWFAQVYTKGKWKVRYRGKGWVVVPKKQGEWRGVADMSRCVADAIGHTGLRPVRLELLAPRKKEKPRVALFPRRDAPVHAVRSPRDEDTRRSWARRPFVNVVVRRRGTWARRGRNWPGVCWASWSFVGPVFRQSWYHLFQHSEHSQVSTAW